MEANFAVVDFLTEFAAGKGATPAQVALAWLLAQRPWIVPIPGATRLEHIDDNLPAAALVLDAADLARLDQVFAGLSIVGAPVSSGINSAIQR